MSFALNFKMALKKSGFSQAELAKNTNIPRSNINDYLKNKYKPKYERIEVLAKALDVDPQWLAGYNLSKINLQNVNNLYLDDKKLTKQELEQVINYIRLIRLMGKD